MKQLTLKDFNLKETDADFFTAPICFKCGNNDEIYIEAEDIDAKPYEILASVVSDFVEESKDYTEGIGFIITFDGNIYMYDTVTNNMYKGSSINQMLSTAKVLINAIVEPKVVILQEVEKNKYYSISK